MVSFYVLGAGKPGVLQSMGSQRIGRNLANQQQQFHRLMSGRIIPTILGKGQRFPGTGPMPTFGSLMVGLGTVLAPADVSFSLLMCCYNETILMLKVWWKSTHLPSWI